MVFFHNPWHWAVVGLLLILLEFITPGVYVCWIGLGALLTAISVFIWPNLSVSGELLVFSVFSVIAMIAGIRVYRALFKVKPLANGEHINQGAEQFIGQTYVVCDGIKDGQGKIKIGDSVWIAVCDTDIPKGTKVKVVKVNGTVLQVEK